MARYKCHTTHTVLQGDHDAVTGLPNTIDTHFYPEQFIEVDTIHDYNNVKYKCIKRYGYFEGDTINYTDTTYFKAGTLVNVGQTFQADNGTYTCIKEFWHWSVWTDFRVSKGNNEYFTYKTNDPLAKYSVCAQITRVNKTFIGSYACSFNPLKGNLSTNVTYNLLNSSFQVKQTLISGHVSGNGITLNWGDPAVGDYLVK